MPSNELIKTLRGILVELYGNTHDARGVAQDAGVNLGRVDFNGNIVNVWRSILDEASKTNKIGALIRAAREGGYADHAGLREMAAHFGGDAAPGSTPAAATAQPAPKFVINVQNGQGMVIGDGVQVTQTFGPQINTGGGTYIEGDAKVGGDLVGRDQTTNPAPPTPPADEQSA